MSNDRIRSAIRRIAREDEQQDHKTGDAKNRGDQAAEGALARSDAEQQRICCDGSTSGATNPGTDERDPDAGGQDGATGGDTGNPADLSDMGEGTLTGFTDCATNEPVTFEGGGFLPPDGWDAPDDPPVEEYYNEAFWYLYSTGATSNSCVALASQLISDYESFCGNEAPFTVDQVCAGETLGVIGAFSCSGGARELKRRSCVDSFDSACDLEPPRENSWPEDGAINLAIKDGTIVGSKYDPENDGTYSKPRDEIELCDDQGNRIGLKPSADGGWKTIDAVNGGDGFLYDSSGTQIARISGDEYSDPNV